MCVVLRPWQWRAALDAAVERGCTVERSDEYICTGSWRGLLWAYTE